MEPGLSAAGPSPETGAYKTPEVPRVGEIIPSSPEKPATTEATPGLQQSVPTVSLGTTQLPTLPTPTTSPQVAQANPAGPLVASDEDLVEKEWVDKAKKIVAQTKDNPYTQEKEVSKLQADYIKKRYGKDIKISSE